MRRRVARLPTLVAATLAAVLLLAGGGAGPLHAEDAKPAPAPQPAAAKPAQIDRNGTLILIRTTLIALDQANKTGNYTVLRDLGAPAFQANSAARLGEIFARERNDKLDMSGTAVIDPQLSLLPQIEGNGLMHMAGFFPSVPAQLNFEMLFAPVGGQWRLYGLAVRLGSAAPAAPQAATPATPEAKPETKPEPEAKAKPAAKPAAKPKP